jgi:tetratricopeptide (TPR) repeat protein
MKVSDPKKLLPMQSQALYRLIANYEGLKVLQTALGFRQELLQLMRDAGLKQGAATALQEVAELQARLGLLPEALISYREAVEIWRSLPDASVNEGAATAGLAAVLLQQGLAHEAKSEALAATALLAEADKRDTEKPKPLQRRQPSAMACARARALAGDILARTGNVSQGRELAARALQASETTDKDTACLARITLARCLLESGDVEEAKKMATLALNHAVPGQLLPQIYHGLEVLADACLKEGRTDAALRYLDKMARVAGERAGVASWRGAALQRAADLHEQTGQLAVAERLHREASQLLGAQPRLHSLLALVRLYEKLGNPEAAASFSRMIKHVARDKD